MSATPLSEYGATMRILHPAPSILAFYDGRIAGARLYSEAPNWLDDGAYGLGIATYAIVDGGEALVYDTHVSLIHAALIRARLVALGVTRIRVVMSHWHDDHVAGNEGFADCEIIAHVLTARALEANRARLETGSPAIHPLVMPTRLYEDRLALTVGSIAVELRHVDCHSADGTVIFLHDSGILLAGDTLEDPITYVAEPDRLADHLAGLARMSDWPITRILPNHGDPTMIANGGYAPSLIAATRRYVEKLTQCRARPDLATLSLSEFIADDLAAGDLFYIEPYEAVHRQNVQLMIEP